jgi:signal transduction histidine kinase
VEGPERPLPLPSAKQAQLFAIGREALANVVKHSGAATAHVWIDAADDVVTLQIRDTGKGFAPNGTSDGHYGIDSMKSRAAEIGGRLSIASSVGYGTAITVTLAAEDGA